MEDTPPYDFSLAGCQALLQASPAPMAYKDADGVYRLANTAFVSLLDRPLDAVVGQNDDALFPPDLAGRLHDADQHVMRTGESAHFEYQLEKDTSSVWIQVYKSPVRDASGRISGVFACGYDVTETKGHEETHRRTHFALQQRLERRNIHLKAAVRRLHQEITQRRQAESALAETIRTLNLILDNSPIGITLVSDRVVRWANPRFYALFTRPPGSLVGKPTRVFYPDHASYEEFGQLHYPKLARGERVDVVWTMRRADGTNFFCRIIGQLLYRDRPHEGSIWLMEDVTERRLAEEAAQAAERLKREFVDSVSHEIRTPLNGIRGMTTLLAATSPSEEQQELIATLDECADALTTLVESLLDFSRLGTEATAETAFRPRSVVESVLQSISGAVQAKHLRLEHTIAPAVPEAVTGDADGVRKILAALLSNAVKFTEQGEITVTLTIRTSRSTSADAFDKGAPVELTFAVTDTGIGIAPEQLATIFKPFRQGDGSHTRRYGGTGLGLAIASQTAAAMGGAIRVVSEPGTGSTFSFSAVFTVADPEDGIATGA